jgi:outer membrane receptor protein involved in Fe transport
VRLCAVAAMFGAASASAAAMTDLTGRRLTEVIASLEDRGIGVLYSSDLVRPWMRVRQEPDASEPRAILAEIVTPFGLAVRPGPNGSVLLVRAPPERTAASSAARAPTLGVGVLEEVVVTTSRYRLAPASAPPILLRATELERLPDLGDDPLRGVSRLPGAAAGDFTAKANIRGGEGDEMLVRFDGLRLFNPFHFKDFQSVFSTIDPGIIRGIDVYTGAFPAAFGDRMSGVIDIASLSGGNAPQRELSLSFFNASGRIADSFEDGRGQWLLAARRSNLDLLLDALSEKRGEPTYTDAYARLGYQLTDALALTGNLLRFHDDIDLNDTDLEEQAEAIYRDDYYWARLDYEPGPEMRGSLMLARSQLESDRFGTLEQPGVASGRLEDRRSFTVNSLQTDWQLASSPRVAYAFGAEWRRLEGRYDYSDEAEFDLLFLTPGAPDEPTRSRQSSVRPSGHQVGAYASVRLQPSPVFAADLGLRWDNESLSPSGGERWSPRLGLLWSPGERAGLRLGWGRFYQSQAINELQISDGVTEFQPAQRADHWVGSLEYAYDSGVKLRIEAYSKDYVDLRPRYENLLNSAVLLPELKPDRVLVAPSQARARGVEFTLSRRDEAPFDWWFTYAWSSVRDEFADTEVDRSWDQTNAVSAGLGWQTGDWEMSVAGRYRTGWPTTAFELASTDPLPLVSTGPRNAERLGNYASVDARIARKFRMERAGDLTVFLEVTNLFNEHNECCVEYEFNDEEAPEGLEFETTNYLPVFPSLGVIWRF